MTDYGVNGAPVDSTGNADVSGAFINAINAANAVTSQGAHACVYVPTGVYRIVSKLPEFARAGCIEGDGSTLSRIVVDGAYSGDLFSWSEAWAATTPGPRVVGIGIVGNIASPNIQNAFVFYDRNDRVFFDDIDVDNLHGRALYVGATQHTAQAYMRESHFRSLRFFNDGAPGLPVVEFNSAGGSQSDATNQIQVSQMDIYGPLAAGLAIRNSGSSVVRALTFSGLRIEGLENGKSNGDLLTVGDTAFTGNVNTITFTDLDLENPPAGFAALRLTAAPNSLVPYLITATGFIGGGTPYGQGLRIDAGRTSIFRLSTINTVGTNVVLGRGVSQIFLDGGGQEAFWTYSVDPTSYGGLHLPSSIVFSPTGPK